MSLNCTKEFQITIESAFDCGGDPSDISAAVWAQSALGGQPPLATVPIVAASAAWSIEYNTTTQIQNFMSSYCAKFCNPGDEYQLRLTVPWDNVGSVIATPPTLFTVKFGRTNYNSTTVVDLVQSSQDVLDPSPYPDFVLDLTIPAASKMGFVVTMTFLLSPAPSVTSFSTSNLSIAPVP